jgi:hypothetical protein
MRVTVLWFVSESMFQERLSKNPQDINGTSYRYFSPKWDEIPNSHFGFHFFDSLRCIRQSGPHPDYAIVLPQIVNFRIGWWVSNTVRNKYFRFLSKGVPQKIDFIFGPANMGLLPLLS